MKYMLLIYDDPQIWARFSEDERDRIMGEYRAFTDEVIASGHFVSGSQLHAASAATSVRKRGGKRLLTDGPFMETREQLGGYYLIDARDLDEALGLAERIPSARFGTVEVRPLIHRGEPAAA